MIRQRVQRTNASAGIDSGPRGHEEFDLLEHAMYGSLRPEDLVFFHFIIPKVNH